jgi:nucleoside-diphosphate-sugar epimerase
MRVFLAGATGVIGSPLVLQLLEAGHEVTAPYTPQMSLRGASNAKAKRELGWRLRYASRREGIAASLA